MTTRARSTLAALGLVLATVAAVLAIGAGEESQAARGNKPPNVVVIMSDDQFNTTVPNMPFVNARDDWARFSNAVVNTALCCPSRATFFTGQTSTHNGIENNSATSQFKGRSTIANWLHDAGYQTGFVGKYFNKFPWGEADNYIPKGWDYWAGYSGKQTYQNFLLNENGTLAEYKGSSHNSTDVLTDRAVDYIDQVDRQEPFFAFVSYNGPHAPSIPPTRYADADVDPIPEDEAFLEEDVSDKPKWIRQQKLPDLATLRQRRIQHQRALLAVDDGVKDIFGALEARGELDDTIVMYTTDHGISLGEHRYAKKTCGYEVCSRVPFLVRGPGVQPGGVRNLVGNIDFAPTIADYAGIPTGRRVDGVSLKPLLEGDPAALHKGVLLSRAHGQGDRLFWGLRTKKWKYIHYRRTDELELYNLKKDREELFNLMSTDRTKWKRKAETLEKRMKKLRRSDPVIQEPTG
jgi:N-acetylglucosamine-6-sulfatase